MNFSTEGLREAGAKEKQLKEFFQNLKVFLRCLPVPSKTAQLWTALDRSLNESLTSVQSQIHTALLNNFDFPTATSLLFGITLKSNLFLFVFSGWLSYFIGPSQS
jgi:hypothetical protein